MLENETLRYDSKINSIIRNQEILFQQLKNINNFENESILLKLINLQYEFIEIENFVEQILTGSYIQLY